MTETMQKHDLVITRVFDTPSSLFGGLGRTEHVMPWSGTITLHVPVPKSIFAKGEHRLSACVRQGTRWPRHVQHVGLHKDRAVGADRIHPQPGRQGWQQGRPGKHGLAGGFPAGSTSVVTFKALGNNKTELTITEYGWTAGHMMELSQMGMKQCLDKMAASFVKA